MRAAGHALKADAYDLRSAWGATRHENEDETSLEYPLFYQSGRGTIWGVKMNCNILFCCKQNSSIPILCKTPFSFFYLLLTS